MVCIVRDPAHLDLLGCRCEPPAVLHLPQDLAHLVLPEALAQVAVLGPWAIGQIHICLKRLSWFRVQPVPGWIARRSVHGSNELRVSRAFDRVSPLLTEA